MARSRIWSASCSFELRTPKARAFIRNIDALIVRKSILIGEKCKDPPKSVILSRVWQHPSITSSIKPYSLAVMFSCLARSTKEESMTESLCDDDRVWLWRTRWTILCIPMELVRMRRCWYSMNRVSV
jgi:hypothetical protein